MPSVDYSTVLNAPIDRVWSGIRDFGKLDKWHPLIVDCEIEDGLTGDQIGCVRRFHLEDGSEFREKLLALSDFKCTFSYSIVDSPLPLTDYVATVKLIRVTDGERCFVSWSSGFQCPDESRTELEQLVREGVYQSGLESVRSIVENR